MGEAVSIAPAGSRGMVAVTAFRDAASVGDALAGVLGVRATEGAGFAQDGEVLLFRLSPARFFVMSPDADGVLERVAGALDGLASVTDQGDAWAVFAVSGVSAHEVLARVVPVDLDPGRFAPGAIALTRAGSMDVRLWKRSDGVFEIACGRSMAADLSHALHAAAAT